MHWADLHLPCSLLHVRFFLASLHSQHVLPLQPPGAHWTHERFPAQALRLDGYLYIATASGKRKSCVLRSYDGEKPNGTKYLVDFIEQWTIDT